MERIALADAIEGLRREIVDAIGAGEGEEVRFRLEHIDLELKVGLTRQVGAKGGIKAWIVEFGADGKRETSDTQTIKLSLKPHGPGGMADEIDVRSQRSRDPTKPAPRASKAAGSAVQ